MFRHLLEIIVLNKIKLFTCLLLVCATSLKSYSQDTTSFKFLQKQLRENFPKKRYKIKETTSDFKNFYQYDKETNVLFNLFSNKISHDTAFIFYYLKNEVIFCELIVWPDPNKKKGRIYGYYVNNREMLPLKNQEVLNISPTFLIDKGIELYRRGTQYLKSQSITSG